MTDEKTPTSIYRVVTCFSIHTRFEYEIEAETEDEAERLAMNAKPNRPDTDRFRCINEVEDDEFFLLDCTKIPAFSSLDE